MLPVLGKATSIYLGFPTPPHLKSRNYQSAHRSTITHTIHRSYGYVAPYDHPKTFASWVVSTHLQHICNPPSSLTGTHFCLTTTTTSVHTVWWFRNPKQPPKMYKSWDDIYIYLLVGGFNPPFEKYYCSQIGFISPELVVNITKHLSCHHL